MRLDAKMKTGGPWNLKGLRPEARTVTRDAAGRSGMSVGEWVNSVVEPTEPQDTSRWSGETGGRRTEGPARQGREEFRDRDTRRQADLRQRDPEYDSDEPRREGPPDDEHGRFEPHRERAPLRHDGDIDEPRWRSAAGGDARLRQRNRRHQLYDREIDELRRQFASEGERADERHGERIERSDDREFDGGAQRPHRDQAQEPASFSAKPERHRERGVEDAGEQNPSESGYRFEPDTGWPQPVREVRSSGDERQADWDRGRSAGRQVPPHRSPDEEPRAERQRRERDLFQRAASAAAEQRREASIDQAVAEIAARQRALDQDRSAEPARTSVPSGSADGGAAQVASAQTHAGAAPMPMPSAGPSQVSEPEIRRDTAASYERAFAPWPEGWRSSASAAEAAVYAAPPAPSAPPVTPAPPEPAIDLSGLQEQLREMTARIETLRPSRELENAVVGLRADLAEISRSFAEALPRQALESLEAEVKALGQRVDRSRQAGVDSAALSGIEHGLADVREALRGLMPAEGLAGFDGALRAIASKVDAIGAKGDPAALQQLEAAMDVLRGMIARVASDEALAKVADDVRALSAKVDHAAAGGISQPTLAALENRIDILASALNASAEAGQSVPRELEKLLSGLLEKQESVQLTHTDRAALGHLEDRIAGLVRRLDASDARLGLLEGVERGLADLLIHIEQLRASGNAVAAAAPASFVEPAARSDAPISQTEPARQAERSKQTTSSGAISLHDDLFDDVQATPARAAEYVSDVACESRSEPHIAATFSPPRSLQAPALVPQPSDENDEEPLETGVASSEAIADAMMRLGALDSTSARSAARTPIDPNLPPDHPLEPGLTGRPRGSSSAERSAVSETTEPIPPAAAEPAAGKPDFIAAARRAAQAASVMPAQGKNAAKTNAGQPKKLTERLRTLAVAAAVVVIVVGGFHIISRLFEDGSGTSSPARVEAPAPSAVAPAPQADPPHTQSTPFETKPEGAPARKEPPHVQAEPSPPLNIANLPIPAPLPAVAPAQKSAEQGSMAPSPQPLGHRDGKAETKADTRAPEVAAPAAGAPLEIAGALPEPSASSAPAPRPAQGAAAIADRLPAAIGGTTLRIAALAGDPLAAYEVGVRFSEGRGVPANNEEAAHWFEIAAKKGIVPAQFRLGTLYEKGLGVTKDPIAARDYYRAAADKGHAKAMHNLAVIYAEGAEGKPDYATAAQWFRKAADYGVADSQYNLAILYARGVGVEQNLAESYKWFFLAAKEGDQDAAQKRDEIGSRLDRPTLAAARAAAEAWTATPQPADAVTVKGVWDPPGASQPAAKPKPRSAKALRREAAKVD
jgi:localization factor PodJL